MLHKYLPKLYRKYFSNTNNIHCLGHQRVGLGVNSAGRLQVFHQFGCPCRFSFIPVGVIQRYRVLCTSGLVEVSLLDLLRFSRKPRQAQWSTEIYLDFIN